ncbi:MAG TPA: SxtJ family membrane protein [Bryobacteraceae bacterium]|nr:SxtJ family membrane protein [Bryobacteraceae bacterium]
MTKTPRTALIIGLGALLASAWNAYRVRGHVAEVLAGIGIVLTTTGLIPAAARAFHREWMKLAAGLGYINSRVLLSIVYVAILAPYGVALRVFGRDPLNRRGPAKATYWLPRPATHQRKDQFERLF